MSKEHNVSLCYRCSIASALLLLESADQMFAHLVRLPEDDRLRGAQNFKQVVTEALRADRAKPMCWELVQKAQAHVDKRTWIFLRWT